MERVVPNDWTLDRAGDRRRMLEWLPVLGCVVLGLAIRVWYVYFAHPPGDFVISDMRLYADVAKVRATPGAHLALRHMTHPPGFSWLLSRLMWVDGEMKTWCVHVLFLASALIPWAAGWLAYVTFGRRAALVTIAAASLYWPFIEYAGYFLAEVPFTLVLTISAASIVLATRASGLGPVKSGEKSQAVLASALAGLSCVVAMSLKSVGLVTLATFFGVMMWRAWRSGALPRRIATCSLAFFLAQVPLGGVMALECTEVTGSFCVTGTKMSADMLLGHYGRIFEIVWAAPKGQGSFRFGGPSAMLRHYQPTKVVPFAIGDGAANRAELIKWVSAHPVEALALSFEHVFDLFFSSEQWPGDQSPLWPISHQSQFVFILFIFLPAAFVLRDRLREDGPRGFLRSLELALFSPLVALSAIAFIAVGEARYRVPFDVFLMAIAFSRIGAKPANGGSSDPAATSS